MKVHMEVTDEFIDDILVRTLQKSVENILASKPIHAEDWHYQAKYVEAANTVIEHFGGTSECVKLPWEEDDKDWRQTFWDKHDADIP